MAPPSHAVVVRSHNPTEAALARMASWARDLEGSGVALIISLDMTTQSSTRRRLRASSSSRKRSREEDGVCRSRSPARLVHDAVAASVAAEVHVYDEAEMVEAYPALREVAKTRRIADTTEFKSKELSLAWGFHVEALNLWYQRRRTTKVDFVWKLEDDVGFSGSLLDLVRSFEDDGADLLTADVDHRPGPRWWWADAGTAEYYAAYGRARQRLASREHAQRFSRALLDRLHALSVDRGITAWSEALPVVVCAAAEDLVLAKLPRSLLGDPFAHDGRVTERAWRDICEGRSARKKGRLYHALKF